MFSRACLFVTLILGVGGAIAGEIFKVATFNVSFNSRQYPALGRSLAEGKNPKMEKVSAILREVRPDVVLLAEFDLPQRGDGQVDLKEMEKRLGDFRRNYLERDDLPGTKPVEYDHHFIAPTNTGVPSGMDLDRDGKLGSPADCWGYGEQNGQFGFVLLSRFPLKPDSVRTFREFRWASMPGNLLPASWYGAETTERLRLSSKNHVDVVVDIDGVDVHCLLSHPTPPSFDGPEDRNGRRNFDEIRLWADYIEPGKGTYLTDDQGRRGGLGKETRFVILGDLNADPRDGSSLEHGGEHAINQLLEHPLVQGRPAPESQGALESVNAKYRERATKTADFGLRADYVLPSGFGLTLLRNGVFWPAKGEPGADWVKASDHRLVWAELELEP